MHRPEQNVAYRVYWQGKDLLGTAQIEMPQVQYMTETLSGSGLAGEIESPTIGLTQSMTCKMTFTSATKDVFDILDWTLQPLFECYSALQIVDESTSIRESIPYRLNIVGRPKNMSLGTMEQGKKHGNDLELEVTRLEILLDGEEQDQLHPPGEGQRPAGRRPRPDGPQRIGENIMEKTAQATLSAPITVQGKKTDILTLRRATLGDDEDAMDMAISFNRGNNPVTVELCTLSIVTGVPYDVLRTLDEDDIGAIRAAHNSLRPTKPKKKEEAETATATTQGEGSTASA